MSRPRNARRSVNGRTYQWRDELFDSVTTILSGGFPKPALVNWAAKSVAEWAVRNQDDWRPIANKDTQAAIDLLKGSPYRERDAAADLGSHVHRAIDAYIVGRPMPEWPLPIRPSMAQFAAFLERFSPTFEASEATVYSRQWGYAGTFDFIATIDGKRVLGDVKTGKGVYGEVALQLAAYRNAEFIGGPDGAEHDVPAVDACVVLHIRPDVYELYPVDAGDEEFKTFLYVAQVRRFVNQRASAVIGAPLNPGELGGELLVSREEVTA